MGQIEGSPCQSVKEVGAVGLAEPGRSGLVLQSPRSTDVTYQGAPLALI